MIQLFNQITQAGIKIVSALLSAVWQLLLSLSRIHAIFRSKKNKNIFRFRLYLTPVSFVMGIIPFGCCERPRCSKWIREYAISLSVQGKQAVFMRIRPKGLWGSDVGRWWTFQRGFWQVAGRFDVRASVERTFYGGASPRQTPLPFNP